MYRQGISIETFEGATIKCNIEGVGKKKAGYLWHFDCGHCLNQSIGDDEGTCWSCNGFNYVTDKTDRHIYCLNYRRDNG